MIKVIMISYFTPAWPSNKAGLGIGYRGGRGIVLARLPPLTATGPPRWSAPIFVKVRWPQNHVD